MKKTTQILLLKTATIATTGLLIYQNRKKITAKIDAEKAKIQKIKQDIALCSNAVLNVALKANDFVQALDQTMTELNETEPEFLEKVAQLEETVNHLEADLNS
ncbi:hypothetical protein [Ligilactobacillus ceti]|uniref:Uncharacterized protein n=1 Tax=Ligilactobacillus ceti DSM 22408 TaxID=1122146 RepID=A0A0R2KGL6_9LACO|nr:hypothetical protein [Ligilactobacillus ceti]KRN88511.1 hypothetical protein IV53_GL000475 [Ligilactobacillus ceti DSM 22408]